MSLAIPPPVANDNSSRQPPRLERLFSEDAVFPVILSSNAPVSSPVPATSPGVASPGTTINIPPISPSPHFPELPLSAVSFSEYVQSELASAQASPHPRQFPPVAAVAAALAAVRLNIPSSDSPPPPAQVSSAHRDPHESMHRSETLPNFSNHEAGDSTESTSGGAGGSDDMNNAGVPGASISEGGRRRGISLDGSESSHSAQSDPYGPGHSRAPSRTRWSTLDCLQLDDEGGITERVLTRSDILQEARSARSSFGPSMSSVAQLLAQLPRPGTDAAASAGAAFDVPRAHQSNDGRRATQRALRDYLRNSLQVRDIRQVDPAFAAKPALWVRHSALVVSLEGIRAIIFWNKMYMFDTRRPETKELASIAQKCVTSTPDVDNPQPFEFNALEGILIFIAVRLERVFNDLKVEIDMYIHQWPSKLTTKMLEELRRRKQQLKHFHSRASTMKTILENLLDEDEEMANMYLTEKQVNKDLVRPAHEHMEVETLLEAYLQVIDEHVNHSTLLNDAIDDTEDLLMIHLDKLRNRLLSVELVLSVVSMTFALGGVIAGVFGMNLHMPLFEDNVPSLWFFLAVGLIVAVVTIPSWLILTALKRRGLYSVY